MTSALGSLTSAGSTTARICQVTTSTQIRIAAENVATRRAAAQRNSRVRPEDRVRAPKMINAADARGATKIRANAKNALKGYLDAALLKLLVPKLMVDVPT